MHESNVSGKIVDELNELVPINKDVLFVCIGTDRSTGDAWGPLVGSKLMGRLHEAIVYGTLENPVHAVNLSDTLEEIKAKYPNHYVVAIDACLGQLSSVGKVKVGIGPLKPGAGVNKVLPPVGDCNITGIVNVGGFMEYFVLQNTRLSLVMRMADYAADEIYDFIQERTAQQQVAATNERKPRKGRIFGR